MVEQIRQKLTETIFWLHQAAEHVAQDEESRSEIRGVIADLEQMDLSVARAFRRACAAKKGE
jgi:hypothetical protein